MSPPPTPPGPPAGSTSGNGRSDAEPTQVRAAMAPPAPPPPGDETTRIMPSARRAPDRTPPDAPPSQDRAVNNLPVDTPVSDETRIVPPARTASPAPTATMSGARLSDADTPTLTSRTTPRPSTIGSLPGQTLPHSSPSLPGATPGDAPMRQVGRYLIQQLLGRGGMATVYRAHDPSIGRDVAIKFLHASLCEDEECRTRFLREARAAGGLSHANIVIVHDVGEIEGRPFMAMELIDGTPLDDVLEKRRQLPVRDVVLIGLQLARALEYAHARGIVHRDIKPGNIMLLRDGQSIKVTDFGIAHMDDGLKHRTQVGAVIGTPHYMSPEQARGEKLDGRSDLFAAGIVLYEMLTGERPFRGDNLVAVVNQIATATPPAVNTKRPDAPASLRRVIERCLAKAPAERYPSGQELSAALRKVLDDIDETAKEKDKPRIVPLRVKWALMMAAIVAVVMGLSAAVITQRQYAALMNQASDYGAALARFIAAQNAAAVLGEDWVAVDVAIQEVMKTRNFERIVVVDGGGVVRSATVGALVGQPYRPAAGESRGMLSGGVAASRYVGADGRVLGFEAPITYLDKQVGRVALGIPEQPLSEVARLSITLMIVLAVVTVLAVAIAMYFVANWFARPIRLVADSMVEIGKGRFSHRIGEARKDEFGQLFLAFDEMAQALQRRETGGTAPSDTPPTRAT